MDRRGFLKGILIATSATASTALVKLATPEEAMALKATEPIALLQNELPASPFTGTTVTLRFPDGTTFTHEALEIRSLYDERDMIDVTSYRDSSSRFIDGPRRQTYEITVAGPVTVTSET